MKKIVKEPLIYFFVLGFVVFGLHSFLDGTDQEKKDPFMVEITSTDIEWVRSSWEAKIKRQPTERELQGLINRFIRDEILFREALAMDLDDRDLVIQRRLVQKLTFVLEDLAETVEPTDDQLKEYLEENQGKYLIPEMISFIQVYFSPEKRDDAMIDAQIVLARLKSEKSLNEDSVSSGDSIMIHASYHKKSFDEVAGVLGKQFADKLFTVNGKGWQGPIVSTFGQHLVYISERTASRMPQFDTIRDNIKNDFMYGRKKEIIDTAYTTAKSRYTILVEGLPYE